LLLFALAAAVRTIQWPTVLPVEGLYPPEPDAYYHLRRIWYSVVNFPDLLTFDPYLNFPHGANVIWTPPFDWLLALGTRLTVGASEIRAMERLVAWAPVVLGGMTVVTVYGLGRRFVSQRAGLLAGILLAFLPAHFNYSRLGFVDHHAAVAWWSTLLLWSAMAFVSRGPEHGAEASPGRRQTLALGLALGGSPLLWPGALLHVGLVETGLVFRGLGLVGARAAGAFCLRLALAHALACVIVAPFGLFRDSATWGAFTPLVLSNFQPLWFAAAAAWFLCLGLLSRTRLGATRLRRAVLAVALGGLGLAAALVAVPELLDRVLQASGWFQKDEHFQLFVAELRPLFVGPKGFDPTLARRGFSDLVLCLPVLFGIVAWRQRRPELRLFLWWTAALFGIAASQQRFSNSFSVAFALLVAAALDRGAEMLSPRLRGRRGLAALAATLTLLGLALAFRPAATRYRHDLVNLVRVARGERPVIDSWSRMNRVRAWTAQWLGRNSPATSGFLDTSAAPEYAVLSAWADGHAIRYLAERAPVQDNFGVYGGRENFERAETYFAAESEAEALAVAEDLGVRYVVVRGGGSGHSRGYTGRSLFQQLFRLRGVGTRNHPRARSGLELGPLLHHRLVFESPPFPGINDGTPRVFSIYEIVPGARIAGHAQAGERVTTRLVLRLRAGDAFVFEQAVRADDQGRYELVLPYPSQRFSPDVLPTGPYEITAGARTATLVVSDAAVRAGARLEGPDL
jgi:dolichyl-diphosphooligosaccharide--protein glycosyltransferase